MPERFGMTSDGSESLRLRLASLHELVRRSAHAPRATIAMSTRKALLSCQQNSQGMGCSLWSCCTREDLPIRP
jgi:hypothetical protein